jgi:hypothetical protein
MAHRFCVVLVVVVGCAGRSAEPEPEPVTPAVEPDVAEEPEPVTPATPPQPTHVVALGSVIALDGETSLRLADVTIEQIEASPTDPESYPAGSGISVTLVAERAGQEQRATLTLLSAGYESRPQASLHGYRITLLDVEEPHRSPRVALLVEPVEGK